MGKNKGKLKNKEAIDFILVNRGRDDPNYQNPDAPARVLLHVPKEEGDADMNSDHQKILSQIPQMSRGVYTSKVFDDQLREMGIAVQSSPDEELNIDEIKKNMDDLNKENFVKRVNIDLTKNEIVNFEKNSKMNIKKSDNNENNNEEEIVDTSFKNTSNNVKSKNNYNPNELDDRKIDLLFKNAKISAEITEYNEFGLRKDIDPEVLKYISTKEFQPGVDIFIPAPDGTQINENRFDIDIPIEKMSSEYKEVYDALKSDDEDEAGEELEDDFVLLANEGVLPIENEITSKVNKNKDEVVITETTDKIKNPSYKFITKEEKEFLDKQFNKTLKEYSNDKNVENKKGNFVSREVMEDAMSELIGGGRANKKNNKNYKGLTSKFDEEEDYEDYELDESGEFEEDLNEAEEAESEEYEDDGEDDENKDDNDEENKFQFCENNFKIENENEKETKKIKNFAKIKRTADLEIFTLDDMNDLISDPNFIAKTVELYDLKPENENEEIAGITVYYPKKRLDITSIHGKVGFLPKTVGEANVRYNKGRDMSRLNNETKMDNDKSITNTSSHRVIQITSSTNKHATPFNPDEESKDQKKLRKKLVKEEKQEKRKQKKDLKTAYKVI